jgi:two-component system phosphate regulon response regulator PhoB
MFRSGEHAAIAEGTVVVIEDDPDVRGLVTFTLEDLGWKTVGAGTAREGLELVGHLRPKVVVLDLALPDVLGVEVCRRLRADRENDRMGVIMVTARDSEYDRVLGFEVGADDYVVKPFSVRELALRVRALARARGVAGSGAWPTQAPFRWRGLELDPLRHRLRAEGVDLVLRPVEYKILLLLMSSPGRTFSRPEIQAVISPGVGLRTIDTHVSRLRETLGPFAAAVETVPGIGYRLADERTATWG